MNQIALKHCPFCATLKLEMCGKPDDGKGMFPEERCYVKCNNLKCRVEGPNRENHMEAARAWNRRPVRTDT